MNKHTGMATLTVVTGILLTVGLFSIAVVGSGFSDIKKTQNYLVDAKQRAKADAGLHCAVAVFETFELDPNESGFLGNFTKCEEPTGSEIALSTHSKHWTLTSSSGFASSSIVIKPGGGEEAAFKTTGDLTIEGDQHWKSVKGKPIGDAFECTTIIAGGSVTINVEDNTFKTITPGCAEDYSTNIAPGTPSTTNDFENDILVNQSGGNPSEQMDLFKELFGVPRENYELVIAKHKPKQIDTSESGMTGCGATIKSEVDAGDNNDGKSDFIWVKGDCQLDGISFVGSADKPVTIVVQNGIVGVNGNIDAFKGTVFQYSDNTVTGENRMNSWGVEEDSDGNLSCTFDSPTYELCYELMYTYGMTKEKWQALAFFFRGAFISTGGYIVDVPGGSSIMRGAFVGGPPDDPKEYFEGKPSIVKGSFHDF